VIRRAGAWIVLLVLAAGCSGSSKSSAPTTGATDAGPRPVKRVLFRRLVAAPDGTLGAAVQNPATARLPAGGGVALLGGLTAADTSRSDIVTVTKAGVERHPGRLPVALHDAAAVTLGSLVYLFGGGDGVEQLDGIVQVDPLTGAAQTIGRLPARSSDQSGAAIGDTAYVVGGYTGAKWLDTIVAWKRGGRARVVAHLPSPVRYAAVAAADGRVVIAGGSLPNGTASRDVYSFDPSSNAVRKIGVLPAPTTHAAAAALGDVVYVLGGRGAVAGTVTSRIVAVDPVRGRLRSAGRLAEPLSDLGAASVGDGIVVIGGRGASGAVATIYDLRPGSTAHRTTAKVSNVYAADRAGMLSGAARFAKPLVYVPNSDSNTVDVIDPHTFRVVRHFAVGALPQHVVPSWDLKTLYVTNDIGNSLTTIDPRTGRPGRTLSVEDPYNMYFTPDGRYAVVVAERLGRLDFRDAHSFKLVHSLAMPCRGVDHMDYSAGGSYLIASCEFSGQLVKVDVAQQRVVGTLTLRSGAAPQDVKLSPDGSVFYVADMNANGVWLVDGDQLRVIGFRATGRGAHGLYPSRDARTLYVTNRGEGSITRIDFATRRIVGKWRLPGGGSPDMGNVSADGKVLWLSGRYSREVYAISTRDGRLLARIPVGAGPHGLCVWPQPGRYSLGHTGILR
jgi:YVTN family beta-propeller protein